MNAPMSVPAAHIVVNLSRPNWALTLVIPPGRTDEVKAFLREMAVFLEALLSPSPPPEEQPFVPKKEKGGSGYA